MNIPRVRCRNALVVFSILFIICLISSVYLIGRTPNQSVLGTISREKGNRYFSYGLRDEPLSPADLSSDRGTLPVVVVEEHHEVLKYWYTGVEGGIINAKGNTLIHIDGHSDAAPPIFFDGYPKDFYPHTRNELKAMMQRNDAFIVAAAISGLISRYIWIWPKWDSKNHEDPYEASIMLLGVVETVYKSLDYAHIKSCCLCSADKDMNPVECTFLNVTAENLQDGGEMEVRECKIQTAMLHQMIREDIALEMAQNGSLFEDMTDGDKNKVLLDIDEDFYGCESAVKPILDAKLSMKSVAKINQFVDRLFCPKTTKDETMLDKVMSAVISDIRRVKECEKDRTCSNDVKTSLEKYTSKVTENREFNQMICSRHKTKLLRLWSSLFKMLNNLTMAQLTQLKEVGFCFRTTPKANDFGDQEDAVFRVCHGANTPNESVVIYHTPSMQETRERTKLLQTFLQSTQKVIRPSFVTVCRSMRDGYTPRKYFRQIETDVLSKLENTFPRTKVHYDIDLLGGKHGWSGRHLETARVVTYS